MDTALLGLRVALSLACVLGLIWFAGRRLQGTAGVRKQRTVPLSVLSRQTLGKGAGVVLVDVAGRVLLLGVGEQGVRVLTEVDVPGAPSVRSGEVREEIDLATLHVLTPGDVHGQVAGAHTADATTDATTGVPAPHAGGSARVVALAGRAPRAGASPAGVRAPTAEAPTAETLSAEALSAKARATEPDAQPRTAAAGALQGSILSPDTWRRAAGVVHRRSAG
jgi:flagellar protein FliO/FliZ